MTAPGSAPEECLICLAGKSNIGCDALRYLVRRFGPDRLVIIPNADDPGFATWQQSIRSTADRLGVREVALGDVYPVENLLLLSLEFDKLLRPARFASRRLFNIHFSYLPKYKGMYTSIWPILNDESGSGVTLHHIDRGIDTGDVVAQKAFALTSDNTSRELYFKYSQAAYEILLENFEDLLHDRQFARPQSATGSTYYSRGSIDFSKPKVVDFRSTAHQVRNYVRAFAFPEYQLPVAFGCPVYRAELTERLSQGPAGTVVQADEQSFVVNTIDYDVRVLKDHSRALFEAVEAGDSPEAQRLASLTHNINVSNRNGWSALMIASWQHHIEIAHTLVEQGADVNQANLNGTSVLMYAKDGAVRSGDTSLLEYLVARGADASWTDVSGRTVSDYCRASNQVELAEYFDALVPR